MADPYECLEDSGGSSVEGGGSTEDAGAAGNCKSATRISTVCF